MSASKIVGALPPRQVPDGHSKSATDALSASSPGLDIVNEKYIDSDSRDSGEMSFEQFKKMKTQAKLSPRSKGGKSHSVIGNTMQRQAVATKSRGYVHMTSSDEGRPITPIRDAATA